MADGAKEDSTAEVLEQLRRQAEIRWGPDYVKDHQALLQQAADYIVNIAGHLPATETEPGFYQ